MAKKQKQAAKAAVQSTELNKMPVPGAEDTEFSAEEAAQAFQGKNNGKSRRQ
ncbi:hypothetical protein [Paenibacillus antri]|uniref:hypothetical protein n=1 Tax=Paenibacillus antri TaxID=2582848 RepID=UPI001486EFC1|nr:hypothetical protein [Paenibacillus antri]